MYQNHILEYGRSRKQILYAQIDRSFVSPLSLHEQYVIAGNLGHAQCCVSNKQTQPLLLSLTQGLNCDEQF